MGCSKGRTVIIIKICSLCKIEKNICEFNKNKKNKDGYSTRCKDCRRQYYLDNRESLLKKAKIYNKENSKRLAEKRKKQKAEYYLKNKERILEVNKKYRDLNPEKEKNRHKKWAMLNREKKRESWRRREAKRLNNKTEHYTEQDVLSKHGTNCYICLKPINLSAPRQCGLPGWQEGLHMEHVIDLAVGGPDSLENVKPAHGLCNLKKPKAFKKIDTSVL